MNGRGRPLGGRPLWLMAVVLAIWVILTLTLDVGGQRRTRDFSTCLICGSRGTADAILNFFFFVPLGFALAKAFRPRWWLYLAPVLLSIGIEFAQTRLPGRFPTLGDVVTNGTGGVLGILLVARGTPVVRAIRTALLGRAPGVVFALLASVLVLPAILLLPIPPGEDYWTQRTPALGFMGRYTGSVEDVRLHGVTLEPNRQPSNDPIRSAVRAGESLELDIIAGRRTGRASPIFAVYDGYRRQVFMLAAVRDDLWFQSWSIAAALRLSHPPARFVDARELLPEGEPASIVIERLGRATCLQINAERICPDSPDAAWLWSFLLMADRAPDLDTRGLAVIELLMLGLLWGLTARSRRAAGLGAVGLSALYVGVTLTPFLAAPYALEATMPLVGGMVGMLAAPVVSRWAGVTRPRRAHPGVALPVPDA